MTGVTTTGRSDVRLSWMKTEVSRYLLTRFVHQVCRSYLQAGRLCCQRYPVENTKARHPTRLRHLRQCPTAFQFEMPFMAQMGVTPFCKACPTLARIRFTLVCCLWQLLWPRNQNRRTVVCTGTVQALQDSSFQLCRHHPETASILAQPGCAERRAALVMEVQSVSCA